MPDKEATACIKINKLLEAAGQRLGPTGAREYNSQQGDLVDRACYESFPWQKMKKIICASVWRKTFALSASSRLQQNLGVVKSRKACSVRWIATENGIRDC